MKKRRDIKFFIIILLVLFLFLILIMAIFGNKMTGRIILIANGDITDIYLPFEGDVSDKFGHSSIENFGADCSAEGKIGKACSFDGIDDYVLIDKVNLGKTMSVAFWMYGPVTGNFIPFSLDSPVYYSGPNLLFAGKSISWNVGDWTNNPFTLNRDLTSKWTHYVLINDQASGKAKLYVDNVLVSQAEWRDSSLSSGKIYLGRWHGIVGDPNLYRYKGLLDEFRIFNKALSDSEVSDLYNNQFEAPVPNPLPEPKPSPKSCTSFTYSDWGECINNIQTRTLLSSIPLGCFGGNPILSQSCENTLSCSNCYNEKPFSVPGIIEAEDFDLGGKGVSWYDTDETNTFIKSYGTYRKDSTGVELYRDLRNPSSSWLIGKTFAGEWVSYTINVASSDYYDIFIETAHLGENGGKFHLEIDDLKIGESSQVPNSWSWYDSYSVRLRNIWISKGMHKLKLVMDENGTNEGFGAIIGAFDKISIQKPIIFYVSDSSGDDSWSGKISNPNIQKTDGPFKTLKKARDAIRDLKKQNKYLAPINVQIMAGTYFLNEPFQLGTQDSGTKDKPITYENYGDGEVIISGGKKIIGSWQKYNEKIFVIDLSLIENRPWTFNSLFVNEKRAIRAREPDISQAPYGVNGFYLYDLDSNDLYTKFRYRAQDLNPRWKNLQDIEVITIRRWISFRLKVDSIIDKTVNLVNDGTNPGYNVRAAGIGFNWDYDSQTGRYYVENVFEGLDMPGEWYLDKKTNKLYYYPLDGETLANSQIIVPILKNIIQIKGDSLSQRASFINFRGLKIMHSDWDMLTKGHIGNQEEPYLDLPCGSLYYPQNRNNPLCYQNYPGISFYYTSECTFLENEVAHIGGYGVDLAQAINMTVSKNKIWDTGAGGIKGGIAGGFFDSRQPEEITFPVYNSFSDNFLFDNSRIYLSAAPLVIFRSPNNYISYNKVLNAPYVGISAGWAITGDLEGGSNNIIEYNVVGKVMQLVHDGGGIYTQRSQSGTQIRNNYLYEIKKTNQQIFSKKFHGIALDLTPGKIKVFNNYGKDLATGEDNDPIAPANGADCTKTGAAAGEQNVQRYPCEIYNNFMSAGLPSFKVGPRVGCFSHQDCLPGSLCNNFTCSATVGQWANSASASSEYGSSWLAANVIGKPESFLCGVWKSGVEWSKKLQNEKASLTLSYSNSIVPKRIVIYGQKSGFTKIEALNSNNNWIEVWSGRADAECVNSLDLNSNFKTNSIRITTADDVWAGISGVYLI